MRSARQMSSIASSSARPWPAGGAGAVRHAERRPRLPASPGRPRALHLLPGTPHLARTPPMLHLPLGAVRQDTQAPLPCPCSHAPPPPMLHPCQQAPPAPAGCAHPCCASTPAWRRRAPPASWAPCGWWPRRWACCEPASGQAGPGGQGRVGRQDQVAGQGQMAGNQAGRARRGEERPGTARCRHASCGRGSTAGLAAQGAAQAQAQPPPDCQPAHQPASRQLTARMGTGGLAAPIIACCSGRSCAKSAAGQSGGGGGGHCGRNRGSSTTTLNPPKSCGRGRAGGWVGGGAGLSQHLNRCCTEVGPRVAGRTP